MDFRNYDPTIGRFHNPDLLAELNPELSPYRFAFNNPVIFNDPTGLYEGDGGPGDFEVDFFFNENGDYFSFDFLGFEFKINTPEGGPDPEGEGINYAGEDNAEFADSGNIADGNDDCCPTGRQVLEPKKTLLGKFWNMLQPRTWEDPETGFTYQVNSEGYTMGISPIGGIGSIGFIGTGGSSFLKLSVSELKTLISTEKGAQSIEKINSISKSMKKGDISIYSEPIYTYLYKGKTYILDGHHRIKAAIKSNKTLEVIQLNTEKATKLFKNKIEEIQKGMH